MYNIYLDNLDVVMDAADLYYIYIYINYQSSYLPLFPATWVRPP